jgi:hypothetical protein
MRLALPLVALLATAGARDGCVDGRAYDPCAGKACGDACTVCPPGDSSCAETAVVKACDPGGRCVPATPALCSAPPPPHPDCAGKACGEPCNPCGPDEVCPTLIESACDRFGQCSGRVPWLCHDPCAGKACGETCQLCPPDAPDCFETMELKACDARGHCVSATPELACP